MIKFQLLCSVSSYISKCFITTNTSIKNAVFSSALAFNYSFRCKCHLDNPGFQFDDWSVLKHSITSKYIHIVFISFRSQFNGNLTVKVGLRPENVNVTQDMSASQKFHLTTLDIHKIAILL